MGENVKMRKLTSLLLSASALTLGLTGFSAAAQAQGSDDEIEEIVVSGLRGKPRSAVDSAVPVDTFDASQIQAVAATDTQDILQTLVPSYNVGRQPVSDGATFIRPAELRGLPSHHTLVLINGKRRHRASLVSIGGSGTQGPDVATIPAVAIQSVEVLRDGASSQYGSDAIAGVINVITKKDLEDHTISLRYGDTHEGGGESVARDVDQVRLGRQRHEREPGEHEEAGRNDEQQPLHPGYRMNRSRPKSGTIGSPRRPMAKGAGKYTTHALPTIRSRCTTNGAGSTCSAMSGCGLPHSRESSEAWLLSPSMKNWSGPSAAGLSGCVPKAYEL